MRLYSIQFNSIKYAIVHQCFLMTLSRKIVVHKPTLQTAKFFLFNTKSLVSASRSHVFSIYFYIYIYQYNNNNNNNNNSNNTIPDLLRTFR